MSDRDKQMNTGELIDLKSLIGDADGGNFSLDDIMSEFSGHPPAPPEEPEEPEEEAEPEGKFNTIPLSSLSKLRPAPVKASGQAGKVVAFPGRAPAPDPEPDPDPPEEEICEEEVPEPAPIIPFPQEESVLSAFLKDLGKKADDYADHMFEEDEAIDKQEVRRLERLIPGTDQEEDDGEPPSRQWSRPKREERLPPDTAPQELARRYGKGLKWMRTRALLVFILTLLSLLQTLAPMAGLALGQPELHQWASAGLLGLGMLLSADVLLTGVSRACFLKFGMDTMSALACAFTLADGISLALAEGPQDRLPYTLVCLTGLFCLLHGTYHKRCAVRLSCRTAASSATPYRVTLDPDLWNDQDTYSKWSGDNEGFGSRIQADDGAQRIFRRVCPLLLLGDAAFALMASVGGEHPERLLWSLSALFSATAAFGGALAYGRTFHKAARRLTPSGAALAGWPGIAASRRGSCVLLTDGDLFPPGYVELNGFKVMGDCSAERVVAYTATLIRDSGSGLAKLFHDQLRSMGGLLRRAEGLQCHEGGGLSANIRGDQVLVG